MAVNDSNQKILTLASTACLTDEELEQSQGVITPIPDVVSDIKPSICHMDPRRECQDPDIIQSSSSSDETSMGSPRAVTKSSLKSTLPSSDHLAATGTPRSTGRRLTNTGSDASISFAAESYVPPEKTDTTRGGRSARYFVIRQDSIFEQETGILHNNDITLKEKDYFQHVQGNLTGETLKYSDAGRKARQHYCSSGIGTGSESSERGSSASKSSVSQDVDCVQDPTTTNGELQETKDLNCIENDYSPTQRKPSTLSHRNALSLHNITQTLQQSVNQCGHEEQRWKRRVSKPSESNPNMNLMSPVSIDGLGDSPHVLSQICHSQHRGPSNVKSVELQVVESESTPKLVEHLSPKQQVEGRATSNIEGHQKSSQLPVVATDDTGYTELSQHVTQFSSQNSAVITGSQNVVQALPALTSSPPSNQALASSSSAGSYVIPASVENQWLADLSHHSWAKLLLQSSPGCPNSSVETRYHLESLLGNSSQIAQSSTHVEDRQNEATQHRALVKDSLPDSSLVRSSLASVTRPVLTNQDLWAQVKRSMRCSDTDCDDEACLQVQNELKFLSDGNLNPLYLDEAHISLLISMFNHAVYTCDHPKCPFVWCGERIEHRHTTSVEQLHIAKQRLENFADYFSIQSNPVNYMKLSPSISYKSFPRENTEWIRLCMMGNSRKTVLVKPVLTAGSMESQSQYWVIKKISTADEGDHWGLYSQLRQVDHRSVASLLWAAAFDDHILVCSLYEGLSLKECLPLLPAQQVRFVPVFGVIQQLISATCHLHRLSILYLYWSCKNVTVSNHSGMDFVVKIGNFSCSVLLESVAGKKPCYDVGYLQLALPRDIIMPELQQGQVEFASDVWGLACLLSELVTGQPVWHECRHWPDKKFEHLIGTQPPVPDTMPELKDVFLASWQVDTVKRVELSALELMIINAYQVYLGN